MVMAMAVVVFVVVKCIDFVGKKWPKKVSPKFPFSHLITLKKKTTTEAETKRMVIT